MSSRGLERTYLTRTLELASKGRLRVTPNPMVGCVIVRGGRVIAEAYHQNFGEPHAEVLALRSAGPKARGATLYVNLEPCAHHGKTPPCAEAIIRAGVRTVVACTRDPNVLVGGRGFGALRRAGIEVRQGSMRQEAELLNERFFWAHTVGRPFVGVKIAQTLDGRIADRQGRSKWITCRAARKRAHELRSEYEAVLVGAQTVRLDDPSLSVRLVRGRQPVRVVLDGRFQVAENSRVFRSRGGRVIVLTSIPALHRHGRRAAALERRGIEVVGIGQSAHVRPELVLRVLAQNGIQSVLVEGGSLTASHFIRGRVVERLHAFVAPAVLGAGLEGIDLGRGRTLDDIVRLEGVTVEALDSDIHITGRFPE